MSPTYAKFDKHDSHQTLQTISARSLWPGQVECGGGAVLSLLERWSGEAVKRFLGYCEASRPVRHRMQVVLVAGLGFGW